MIIFMSQAPILFVALPLLLLIALFELIGLKVRRNIQVLSVVALACLLAAVPVSASNAEPAALLFATGVTEGARRKRRGFSPVVRRACNGLSQTSWCATVFMLSGGNTHA